MGSTLPRGPKQRQANTMATISKRLGFFRRRTLPPFNIPPLALKCAPLYWLSFALPGRIHTFMVCVLFGCAFISYIGGLCRRGTRGTTHMHNNSSNVWGTFLSNRTCNTLLCDQATLFHVALQIRGGCFTPSMPKSTVPSVVLKLAARCVHHTLAAQSEPNDKNTSRGAGLLHHPASPWIDGKSESRLGKAGGRVNSSGGAVELWSPEERQGSLSVEEL